MAHAQGPGRVPAVLPRPGRVPCGRHDAGRRFPGGVRQGRRPVLRRPADARALGIPPAEHHHRLLPHRHAGPARSGGGLRDQVPRRGRRGVVLVRRRRDQRGRLARGPELLRHPQAAARLGRREQPVRDRGAAVEADGGEVGGRPGPGVRVRGGRGGRQRRPGLLRGHEAGRGQGPERGRSHADRGQHVPIPSAHLGRRRPDVPEPRGGRGGQGPRPHRVVRQPPEGPRAHRRRRDRAAPDRGQGPGRRRGRPGLERSGPGAGDGDAPPVRRFRCLDRGRPREHGDGGHPRRTAGAGTGRRVPGRGCVVTEKNVVQTIHDTLAEEMQADDRVVVLGEDVGARGGVFRVTAGFLDEFGERRVIDTPLAESSIVGVAIGMAMHGLLPVAEIQFADFIHPAFDQLVSEAARIRYRSNGDFGVPLVVRAPWGGGVHGALYHSQSIEAFYGHVPGLKTVVPSTPYDAKGMLRAAIRDPDPVLFLEHKKTYRLIKGEVPDEAYEVPIGVADVKREGSDLTVVAYGRMLHLCLEAAERLAREDGISVEVVDVRTIAPLDKATILDSVRKTAKAMVVYEDNRTYGAGAEIAATIAEELMFELDGPLVRIGGPDIPAMPFSGPLEHFYMPDAERIYERMRDLARF